MEKSGNDNDLKAEAGFGAAESIPPVGSESVGAERGGVVTARGTVDGVVLRLDGRVGRQSLLSAITEFLSTRESFLGGSEVALEWVGAKPDDGLMVELGALLSDRFKITIRSSKLKENIRVAAPSFEEKAMEEKNLEIAQQPERTKARSLF